MFDKLKPKSEFSKNVLTLMTGTTIAQAIPIAISPILTRLYTPQDFGVFALYIGIVSTLSVLSTGRYELAVMLPKKDEDAVNLVVLSLLVSFMFCFIISIIIFFYKKDLIDIFNIKELDGWLYFIPFSTLLLGIYQSLSFWNNRKKRYKNIALSKVFQSSSTAVVNIGIGIVKSGPSGLITGSVIGQIISTGLLIRQSFKDIEIYLQKIKKNKFKIITLAKKYIDFPKINLLHAFLNVFSSNIAIILLSYFFASAITGFYALANRVIVSPMSILTGSYGQVFFQKITELSTQYNKNQEIKYFKQTVYKLLYLSFFPYLLFFIFAQEIFAFIFGKEWRIAGYYAQILIPMLYLRFTGSIVSSIVIVYNQQKKALNIEIINTVLRVFSFLIGGIFENVILGLILFSFTSSVITIYRLFWYIKIIQGRR